MTPIPRKLALCMALAGCGVSLPAAASASADGRAAIAALNDAFGFTERAARPVARLGHREEALARLAALGLAPVDTGEAIGFTAPANVSPPLAAVPAREPGSSRDSVAPTDARGQLDVGMESEPAAHTAAAPDDVVSRGELPTRGGRATAGATEAVMPPGAAESQAADAMAEALAMVMLVDADRPREAPLVPQHTARAALLGPTAGRPPRAAADAGVQPWALPVATALPDLDLYLCRLELPSAGLEARSDTTPQASPGAADSDRDRSVHAMNEPFTTRTNPPDEVAVRAPAQPDSDRGATDVASMIGTTLDVDLDSIGIAIDVHPDIDLGGVRIASGATPDIDLGGVGIGTTPDIDLGRAAGEAPPGAVDIDLELVAGPATPATAAVAEAAAPVAPAMTVAAPALADSSAPRGAAALGVAVAATVDDNRLDRVRGGFSGAGGLEVSFGIERAVYVNGVLVTTTSLNVSGLGGTAAAATTAPIAAAGGGVALVQNGAGNTFLTGSMDAASLGTVVQNTLNNQKIQTVTLINATVNSLQVVKSMNIGSSLRGAMIDSLRR